MPARQLLKEHLQDVRHVPANILWRLSFYRSPQPFVFVFGPPRSGTTLLKALIAAHPAFFGMKFEGTGLLGHHNFFRFHLQEIDHGAYQGLIRKSSNMIGLYERVALHFVGASGARRFVDKVSASDPIGMYQWRLAFPRASFVHIVRDGRDGYCSARNIPRFPHTGSIEQWAGYWGRKVRDSLRFLGDCRSCLIRYEDLTADPVGAMRRLMEFVGETFDPSQLDEFRGTTDLHQRSARHMNLGRPISARSVARWRKELSEEENARFLELAGRELLLLGYDAAGRDDGDGGGPGALQPGT